MLRKCIGDDDMFYCVTQPSQAEVGTELGNNLTMRKEIL